MPIDASARAALRLVLGATLKEIEGGNHGYAQTSPDAFNAELLAFVEGAVPASRPFILAEPTA